MSRLVLGLVCLTSPTAPKSDRINYRAITRKTYLSLDRAAQIAKLTDIYTCNARVLLSALKFCKRNNIGLYRMSSSMFPFADLSENGNMLPADDLKIAGIFAQVNNIRLCSHPDQFCVLSSDSPQVVQNSIAMLTLEAKVFDLIGLPRSHWAAMNIHIGKSGKAALDNFVAVARDLDPAISSRLTIENDEYKQNAAATIETSIRSGIPTLFDYHHELVAAKSISYDCDRLHEFSIAAAATWMDPSIALYHISNGAAGLHDNKHSDLITARPSRLEHINWLEVEAKGKEQAIQAFPW